MVIVKVYSFILAMIFCSQVQTENKVEQKTEEVINTQQELSDEEEFYIEEDKTMAEEIHLLWELWYQDQDKPKPGISHVTTNYNQS